MSQPQKRNLATVFNFPGQEEEEEEEETVAAAGGETDFVSPIGGTRSKAPSRAKNAKEGTVVAAAASKVDTWDWECPPPYIPEGFIRIDSTNAAPPGMWLNKTMVEKWGQKQSGYAIRTYYYEKTMKMGYVIGKNGFAAIKPAWKNNIELTTSQAMSLVRVLIDQFKNEGITLEDVMKGEK